MVSRAIMLGGQDAPGAYFSGDFAAISVQNDRRRSYINVGLYIVEYRGYSSRSNKDNGERETRERQLRGWKRIDIRFIAPRAPEFRFEVKKQKR